jgi:hypothetical protein
MQVYSSTPRYPDTTGTKFSTSTAASDPRHEPQRHCVLEIIILVYKIISIFVVKVYFDKIVIKLDGE